MKVEGPSGRKPEQRSGLCHSVGPRRSGRPSAPTSRRVAQVAGALIDPGRPPFACERGASACSSPAAGDLRDHLDYWDSALLCIGDGRVGTSAREGGNAPVANAGVLNASSSCVAEAAGASRALCACSGQRRRAAFPRTWAFRAVSRRVRPRRNRPRWRPWRRAGRRGRQTMGLERPGPPARPARSSCVSPTAGPSSTCWW